MNFRRQLVFAVAFVLSAMPLLMTSAPASAGSMKEVQILHLEALAQHLYGTFDFDSLEYRNTSFEPAPAGFFLAVSSEVHVSAASSSSLGWETCTTFIEKIPPTGGRAERLHVTKVTCRTL